MIFQVLKFAIVLIVAVWFTQQVRKPGRVLGRYTARGMNVSHSELTDWGLRHVEVGKGSHVLDVGCGGGRTIQKLAAVATEGRVVGVDPGSGSVQVSREQNADAIRAGRVEIHQAPVSKLPLPDAAFDLVTAVETHYYWPDLAHDAREVLRVLKPGGTFIAIAEAYKGSRYDLVMRPAMWILRGKMLSPDEHRDWLASAGFQQVQVDEDRKHGWLCVSGKKA